jgi:O-antigen/teichoic acid export membrane protein
VTTHRRLLSNTAAAIVGSVLQRLLALGTTMLLARGLGTEQFGTYAFIGAYLFLFTFLVDMGLERVMSRELARTPERAGELLGTAFLMRGTLAVLAAALATIIALFLRLPALTWWCILLAAAGMPLSIEILARSFLQSRFEMHYAYLLILPANVTQLVLVALILRAGGGLLPIFAAALATVGMTAALILWVTLPKMRVVWRVNPELVRYLWRESWELGLVLLIFIVALRIDQLLLFWLSGAEELARYAVAVKIVEALSLIPESIMVTVFPLLAATEFSAPARFRRVYELTVRCVVLMVLPLALVITLDRDLVIRLLFGSGYTPAAGALTILSWWMFFAYTGAVYLGLMMVRKQQRVLGVVSLASLAINIVCNLLWIPRWGATGAAAANLVSSAAAFGMFCVIPQTASMMAVCWEEAIRPIVAISVTAAAVSLLHQEMRVIAVAPIYVTVLVLIGGVDRHDWALARALWEPSRRGS